MFHIVEAMVSMKIQLPRFLIYAIPCLLTPSLYAVFHIYKTFNDDPPSTANRARAKSNG